MLIIGARMPWIWRFLTRGSWGHEALLAAAQMLGLGREHAESRTLARCGGHVNSTKKEIALQKWQKLQVAWTAVIL
jgi:hypothetical protein